MALLPSLAQMVQALQMRETIQWLGGWVLELLEYHKR